jgi:hypothetical protein
MIFKVTIDIKVESINLKDARISFQWLTWNREGIKIKTKSKEIK